MFIFQISLNEQNSEYDFHSFRNKTLAARFMWLGVPGLYIDCKGKIWTGPPTTLRVDISLATRIPYTRCAHEIAALCSAKFTPAAETPLRSVNLQGFASSNEDAEASGAIIRLSPTGVEICTPV